MKVGSLFTGIGGFEVGLSQASQDFQTMLVCDNLATSQAVLRHHFPNSALEADVTKLNCLPADIELVTAGFPCQDLSQAGRTAGLAGNRSVLVGEVFRLLEARKAAGKPVPWVLIENVPFMLSLGGGGAMRLIMSEFERLGYRWAYRVVDSFSFGLAQRRERVYLVASMIGDPADVLLADDNPVPRPTTDLARYGHGFYWTEGRSGLGWAVDCIPTLKNGSTIGIASPPAVLLPDGRLVKPGIRTAERLQGFTDDWTKPAESVAKPSLRWALIGNAVSVPVPKWVGGRLLNPGNYNKARDLPFADSGRVPRAARFDGNMRFGVDISTDPLGVRGPQLTEVMGDDFTLLSERATAGFLSRTQRATLKFQPGFIDAVIEHLAFMRGESGDLLAA
ncbi:DNA cytosine methyltransferase [Massilia violaceinigra]|uniref:Cytosine-specific methyltransferase n=1 Tax=Massilia violaceinigra TaxID=2045208 RepID=A0ABY4A0G1_9BURK|nr:DNA cytosine methyltransferase [Massilia violaceinigra]UOD28232.1 DNA cytosine methyltransferase [Massilia violaceinigra]